MAASTSNPIASSIFYGANRSQLNENSHPLPAIELALPPYLADPLTGPSKVWKIFRKQQEALDLITSLKLEGQLLPFSYESVNYERLFLVAHPDIFWFHDTHKQPHLRNTYEIIANGAVSKLYFDLEFDPTLDGNKICDGNEMVKTFIRVVLYYIYKLFHVKYKMRDVLILDSSMSWKFSVHLIFQTPLVFKTNLDAGHFVRYIANELENINNTCTDDSQLQFDIFKETTINVYAIKDLFVVNKKRIRVLFTDLGVYTKNRLFRLYRSTKQGRNSPLLVSSINKFSLEGKSLDDDPVQYERGIFLASLVTYFADGAALLLVKEFEKPAVNTNYCSEVNLRKLEKLHSGQMSPTKTSPYPEVDNYIRTRIQPKGSIYRNVHFPSTNVTVYDIKGYRYCGNIGRWHKSQNIKFIVDVSRGVYYQKCHDVECATYKSPEWPLPPEILFKVRNDDGDSLFENVELDGFDEPSCMEKRKNSVVLRMKKGGNTSLCIENENIPEVQCVENKAISEVQGVGNEISEVQGVENKISEVQGVRNEISEVQCVGNKISNVQCVGNEISNVQCVENRAISNVQCVGNREISEVQGVGNEENCETPSVQNKETCDKEPWVNREREVTEQTLESPCVKIANRQFPHSCSYNSRRREPYESRKRTEPHGSTKTTQPCESRKRTEPHGSTKTTQPEEDSIIDITCAVGDKRVNTTSAVHVEECTSTENIGNTSSSISTTSDCLKGNFPGIKPSWREQKVILDSKENASISNADFSKTEPVQDGEIVLTTISDPADQEMVLNYVRAYEEKLLKKESNSLEPIVKKIKL